MLKINKIDIVAIILFKIKNFEYLQATLKIRKLTSFYFKLKKKIHFQLFML